MIFGSFEAELLDRLQALRLVAEARQQRLVELEGEPDAEPSGALRQSYLCLISFNLSLILHIYIDLYTFIYIYIRLYTFI